MTSKAIQQLADKFVDEVLYERGFLAVKRDNELDGALLSMKGVWKKNLDEVRQAVLTHKSVKQFRPRIPNSVQNRELRIACTKKYCDKRASQRQPTTEECFNKNVPVYCPVCKRERDELAMLGVFKRYTSYTFNYDYNSGMQMYENTGDDEAGNGTTGCVCNVCHYNTDDSEEEPLVLITRKEFDKLP